MHDDFVCYVIEEYKKAHNLDGKTVLAIFERFDLLDFIRDGYDALHTRGPSEIVWNIDEYMRNRA